MSTPKPNNFDIVYSALDIKEDTVLPHSDDPSDEFRNAQQAALFKCPETQLLVWPLFGPLTDISVLDAAAPPGEAFERRMPFVTESPDAPKTFHPIASLPATYPLVSHLRVEVDFMYQFSHVSDRWSELHQFKEDPDATIQYCIDDECKDQPYLWYYDQPKLIVEARERPYVTIGDAVCAIHHWLQTFRDIILVAETALHEDPWGDQWPLIPSDTQFWVRGTWSADIFRQGGVGSGEDYEAEQWEDFRAKAKERRKILYDKGLGGREPGMVGID